MPIIVQVSDVAHKPLVFNSIVKEIYTTDAIKQKQMLKLVEIKRRTVQTQKLETSMSKIIEMA